MLDDSEVFRVSLGNSVVCVICMLVWVVVSCVLVLVILGWWLSSLFGRFVLVFG